MENIKIEEGKCIACGDCAAVCPENFRLEEAKVRVLVEGNCRLCGHCLAVCPAGAIDHPGLDGTRFPELPAALPLSPATLHTFLRSRRSCRVFAAQEVSREDLESLVDIARYAPTGHNSQNFEFLVIRDRELVRELGRRTAAFFGHLHKLLTAPGVELPPWLQTHLAGFRLNWEYAQAGKDRIFRDAPALILVHAPSENISSAQNCHLAMAHIMLQAQAMGLGTCIIGYFLFAAEKDPGVLQGLEVPAGHKVFTCCTVGVPRVVFRRLVERRPPKVRWLERRNS